MADLDYASLIGGGPNDTVASVDAVDPHLAYSYFWSGDAGNKFLDLGDQGDSWNSTGLDPSFQVTIAGGGGDDTIAAGGGNDILSGQAGNDSIAAGEGNNTVSGGIGDDVITAGSGDDRLSGGDGSDTLIGGDGADTLSGGTGNDVLQGGGGNDQILGGAGDDWIDGGAGNDVLYGGPGSDTFFFDSNFGQDVIKDFGTGDMIELKNGLNGHSFASVDDVKAFVTGGTEASGAKFTLIQLGSDSIRIDNMDADMFKAMIASYVKIT